MTIHQLIDGHTANEYSSTVTILHIVYKLSSVSLNALSYA